MKCHIFDSTKFKIMKFKISKLRLIFLKVFRTSLIIVLLMVFHTAFSQTIELVKQSETKFKKSRKTFVYIEPEIDIDQLAYVATFKATGRKSTADIFRMFDGIRAKSRFYGGNCFVLNSFERHGPRGEVTLVLDTYFATDSILGANIASRAKNVCFIFGDDNPDKERLHTFKINGEEKTIISGTYYRQEIKEREEIRINKGGFTGATMKLQWMPDKNAVYISQSGPGFGGISPPMGNVGIGISVNTGSLNYMESNLGRLLIELLEESKSTSGDFLN